MRYHVTLEPGTKPIDVDVEELPTGAVAVKVDGRRADVDAVPAGAQLSVRVDGRVVNLTIEGTPPDLRVLALGIRASVRVESERERVAGAARKGGREENAKVVRSPMPGRVVKVFVQKGDVVEAGQPLLVIEAIEVENEIRARGAGTVAEVHAAAGATVDGNAPLVTLA